MPDGVPVSTLSPDVRTAYIDELLALVMELEPIIVSVGIEASIFHNVRPDQWDNYVLLMGEVRTALASHPDLHVTSYFSFNDMIDNQGNIDPVMRAAWEEIMPYCESVAYSFYPELSDTAFFDSGEYFIIPKDLAPNKPLLIPEFGCRSNIALGFSETLQYRFLSGVASAVAGTDPPPIALIWFAMYDFQYLGAPQWAQDAFATLGMRDYAGTPKLVHAAFKKMRDNAMPVVSLPENRGELDLHVAPNPFPEHCTFTLGPLDIPSRIEIYDTTGRRIESLHVMPGQRKIRWVAADQPSGFYVASLVGPAGYRRQGLLLIK